MDRGRNGIDNPHQNDDPGESLPISMEEVLEILHNGVIEAEHGMIRWSSNYTFLTTVSHDSISLMAVYKPQRGERPLWDFPDGTLCFREQAAFLTSEALGWQIVPPTALREGPRGLGSVQFYIDHDPEYNYFSFDETMIPQLLPMALFDYLINNADRKGGHCLVDEQGHLWGIDHGIAFHAAHKLRTVIWDFAGDPVPEFLLKDVEKLCAQLEERQSGFRCELGELLNEAEINAFERRIHRILQDRHYPSPGSGPNYPWPPV